MTKTVGVLMIQSNLYKSSLIWESKAEQAGNKNIVDNFTSRISLTMAFSVLANTGLVHHGSLYKSCSLRLDICRKGGLICGKKTMAVQKEWASEWLSVHYYPHFIFWWCFETTAGDCNPALLSVHWWVTIHGSLLQKSFPAAPLCVKGGWCQTLWSQLKEAHVMVFGVSLQKANKWFYISAFNHGRVGTIFTREQRTSLLLTCFTVFRLSCVSASLHIEHIQRFSHILLQKSFQKREQLWGRWKVQPVWPVTISRCLNRKKNSSLLLLLLTSKYP